MALAADESNSTPPPDPDSQQSITLATYNIRNGRAWGLETALRALSQMGVDIGILTETKLTGGIHTRFCCGYRVFATQAASPHQGGIALVYQTSSHWQIESEMRHGPNVLSCWLVTGANTRIPIVGAYVPPNDFNTVDQYISQAFERFPAGAKPLLLGDLNADLADPRSPRDAEMAATMAAYGLEDMLQHFQQRRRHRRRHTWRQHRNEQWISSRCDYILGTDRRMFTTVAIRDPRFSSDHSMILAKLLSAPQRQNRSYLNGRTRFPLKVPKWGPMTRADALFQGLKECMAKPTHAQRERRAWISDSTWQLVDRRRNLMRQPHHAQAEARRLRRQIRKAFEADRNLRTAAAGAAIESKLAQHDLQGAWDVLKHWYRQAEERAPKPSRQDLRTVTEERVALYQQEPPGNLGPPVPVTVAPFHISDDVPQEGEIAEAVRGLRSGKAPGPSGLRADQVKAWLRLARQQENPDGRAWLHVVELVQHCYRTGEFPTETTWSTVVLLPKADGGVRGIGLLDIVWKILMRIVDLRVKGAVSFHDTIHGFRAQRGCSTAIIEAKVVQELAALQQTPFYAVFIDLRKAYDTVDRSRVLDILEGYGVGPRARTLLRSFWSQQKLVARQSGYHGEPFEATRGCTQGCLFSPTLFNVMEDAIVRYWLTLVVDDNGQSAAHGMGANVAERLALYYADDGLIGSRDNQWLQMALDVLVALFRRCGLRTNTDKTKVMTCLPGHIRGSLSDPAYRRRLDGHGDSYRQRKRRRVNCPECDQDLSTGSLQQHMRSRHGQEPSPESTALSNEALTDRSAETYEVSFPRIRTSRECPVVGCPGRATSWTTLRSHFMHRHPTATLIIREEGSRPLPRCELCDMFVTPEAMRRGHQSTAVCREGRARKRQRHALEAARRASEVVFTACGQILERQHTFRYLGRPLSANDSDWPALYHNLVKARQRWARATRILTRDGAQPRVSGMFYKAIVQTVLLYGSETWVLTSSMLKVLEGFHNRVARRIAGKMPYYVPTEDRWVYPPTGEALEIAGLYPIQAYLDGRRNRLADYVATRPIRQLYQEVEQPTGGPPNRRWWWDQLA